jgi:eukaryotic-like serine/threonine-protein kinase
MSLCINPSCASPQNSDDQLFCSSCGSEILLEGRYRVIRMLGEGGFGKTYEVSDLDSIVKVLKVLSKNEPKYIELFQREAQVLSQLNHPGIPAVEPNAYFVFNPKNNPEPLYCLVMEKITGLDLQKYLRQRGSPIDQNLAVLWLIQLARILKAVHSQNFLHRDIKPSNIMLKSDGHLALIDFGTVRSITNAYVGKQETTQATRIMSALYTPIEQMKGKPVPQSDFFALGRTFTYLLTGKELSELYDADMDELQWRNAAPNLSPRLAEFIDHLMAPLASHRPANGETMLQKLAEIQQDLRSASSASTPSQIGNAPTRLADHRQGPISTPPDLQAEEIDLRAKDSAQTESRPADLSPMNSKSFESASSGSASLPLVSQDFIARCQRELMELIGPIASIVCQRSLSQNPSLSEQELVEILARQIPSPQDAEAFRRRLRL